MNERKLSPGIVNGIGGIVQATLVTSTGYPFDYVKARLQAGLHKNSWECTKHTIKHTGLRGLYRGSIMPWLSHLVKRPIQYPLSEYMKSRSNGNIINNYLIGGLCGSIGPVFGTPLQRLKVLAQTSSEKNHFQRVYKTEGIKGFYKGFVPTAIKDSVFGMSFIGTYYTFRDLLGVDRWWKNFISGASAYCITWYFFIPIDYVKTNVQKSQTPITIRQVITKTIKTKGPFAFWKGVLPACARTIPVSGIAMTGYELSRNLLSKY